MTNLRNIFACIAEAAFVAAFALSLTSLKVRTAMTKTKQARAYCVRHGRRFDTQTGCWQCNAEAELIKKMKQEREREKQIRTTS
jgi:hypothetical protein